MNEENTSLADSPTFFCDDCPHCGKYVSPQFMRIKGVGRTYQDVEEDYKNGIYSLCDSVDCPFCGKDLYKEK